MEYYNVSYDNYAGDTQLYVSLSANDRSHLYLLSKCIN